MDEQRITARAWSPYVTKSSRGAEPQLAAWLLLLHGILLVVFDSFVIAHHSRTFGNPLIGWTLLIGSTWLLAGPLLVVSWDRRRYEMDTILQRVLLNAQVEPSEVAARSKTIDHWAPAFVVAASALIGIAYLSNGSFVNAQHLGVSPREFFYYFGLLVMFVGAFAAGWGIWAAFKTLAVSTFIAIRERDFDPFAGTESRTTSAVAGFCFASAFIFGIGGAILLPAICASAASSSPEAEFALIVIAVLTVVTATALLVIPAYYFSQRNEFLRREALDLLAVQLSSCGRNFQAPDTSPTDVDYRRLRGLLEMRRHIVAFPQPDPAVEMVKKIPVVVLLPIASVAAAWLAIALNH